MADLPAPGDVVKATTVPDNQESAPSVQSQQDVLLFHVFHTQAQLPLLSQLDHMPMKAFFVESFMSILEQDLQVIGALAVKTAKCRRVANQCQVADQQAIAG